MPYDNATGLRVHNHYGPRDTGNTEGVVKTEGAVNQVAVNFDGEAFPFKPVIPGGAVVTNLIVAFATGAVTAATVGLVDIADADGTVAEYVPVPLGGEVTITGPSAGTVIVEYLNIAQ